MITQVNEKNSAKYRKLFDEASWLMANYLEDTEITDITESEYYIQDLYDYFLKFQFIMNAAAEKDADNNAPDGGDAQYWQKYFSILPLDEPVFRIDANTRKITVPEQFKTIGVEGDINAEIIFFTIDRFFDAMDFGAEEIIAAIEWKRSGDKEGDADKAYIKELTTYDNKILIGWVIDEEIANTAGAIDFAVRLYMERPKADGQGKEVVYSFSTEVARINIAKTLNIYPNSDQILDTEPAAQILSRIASMTTPDNLWGENTLLPPVFVNNIEEDLDYGKSFNISNLDNTYPYKLEGKNTGSYYADLNDSGVFEASVKGFSQNATGKKAITYLWHEWDNSTGRWNPIDSAATEAAGGNTLSIQETGRYKCLVQDTVSATKLSKADSEILYILEPEKPHVKISEEDSAYYSEIIPDEVGSVTLTVKPLLNDGEFITWENDANKETKLEYLWYKAGNVDGANKEEEYFTEENSYSVTEEGYYFGSVKTNRNKKSNISKDKTIYRVTKNLNAPSIDQFTVETTSGKGGWNGSLGDTITIKFADDYFYDSIQYQWYERQLNTEYTPVINGKGYLDATTRSIIEFKPKEMALYTIKIIVNRNGQTVPILKEEESLELGAGYDLLNGGYITIS